LTYIVGAFASRKFGLPGLARSVETEQAALITAQKGRIDILSARVTELESCQPRLEAAEKRNDELEAQVNRTHAELVELYRLTGNRPRPNTGGRRS
jgi:hypothetical protein